MQVAPRTYLHFVDYSSIKSWSSYALLGKNLLYTQKYPFIAIGDFLKRNKTAVSVEDDILYKRATIRINGNGISLRDEVLGKSIGTKNQFLIRQNQFLLSKIDARNGAFGVVPIELDGGIITGNFWTFDVDYSIINPYYLTLLTGTKEFQKLCQTASVGTTNRNYLQENLFLSFEIPLPSLTEQEKLVADFNQKIQQAEQLSLQGNDLEREIESHFLEHIGLKPYALKEKSFGLFTVNYAELERWDFFSGDARINSLLAKSKYAIVTIGNTFDIAKRTWNKKIEKKETFKYIEIGAIDPVEGIMDAKEIITSKAPSRATQTVKTGDLIIGTTRPYLKKFAIVDKNHDGNVCSSGFTVIASSKKYYLPYLLQFLRCSYGIEQLRNKMTGGLYPAITEAELKEIRIPLPDVKTQENIMKRIAEKEREIIANRETIELLKQQAQQEFEQAIFS